MYRNNLGFLTVMNNREDVAKAGLELALPRRSRLEWYNVHEATVCITGRRRYKSEVVGQQKLLLHPSSRSARLCAWGHCPRGNAEQAPREWEESGSEQSGPFGWKTGQFLPCVSPSQILAWVLGCVCAGRNATNTTRTLTVRWNTCRNRPSHTDARKCLHRLCALGVWVPALAPSFRHLNYHLFFQKKNKSSLSWHHTFVTLTT